MYESYGNQYWFFEAVEMLRRLVLTAVIGVSGTLLSDEGEETMREKGGREGILPCVGCRMSCVVCCDVVYVVWCMVCMMCAVCCADMYSHNFFFLSFFLPLLLSLLLSLLLPLTFLSFTKGGL